MVKSLESLLACPICYEELKKAATEYMCSNCDQQFKIQGEKDIISFISEKMYASKNDYQKSVEVIEFWGNGWLKKVEGT